MTLLNFPPAIASMLASSRGRILVTGAGGWFGLATLEMLEQALGADFDHRVFPFARNAREVTLRSGRRVGLQELEALERLPIEDDAPILANYAFLTREKVKSLGLSDYIRINRELTRFVTTEALRLGAAGIFSTSSGAVYRKDGSLETDIDENPYGFLKLEEEAAVDPLRREKGVRTAVCRVFNRQPDRRGNVRTANASQGAAKGLSIFRSCRRYCERGFRDCARDRGVAGAPL